MAAALVALFWGVTHSRDLGIPTDDTLRGVFSQLRAVYA